METSPDPGRAQSETAEKDGSRGRGAPGVVAPSNRVTIAFPFSQIKLQEPTQELADLASLLCDLIVVLEDSLPEDSLREIRERALALRTRLA